MHDTRVNAHHVACVAGVKVIHARQQPLGAKRRQYRQMQRTAFGLVRNGLQGCTADTAEGGGQFVLIQRTSGGQFDASAVPFEQLDLQLRLQCLHLAADRALGQGQFFGGFGKAAMPCGGLESE
ncbi:cobalamin biosynthesis protein CobW [Pseudomonas syringae pv. spinaceae]|uniref:Cobalamin biosynthesis protein CobW n=1 Tax=Pseudomonas syringae pv. spinaceae TaxID=264459 RepID=A0A0Q0CVI6_PSESX|nr:cobalamin biosynthesis protein CobW [Pseudomonas syringae pv. spinaceae]